MATRREALVKAGLAKPGRGKFSKDAIAWLDNQRKSGVKFSDDDAPVKSAPKVSKTKDVKPVEPSASESSYLFPDEYRYPEKEYRAFIRDGGKKRDVSLRECCNTCRVSLLNHGCEAPTIHGNIAVTIERR